MNSSQRRKNKREFPYLVRLDAAMYSPYYVHDEKIEDARGWCRKKIGDKHKVTMDWDHAVFKFAREKDAIHFALKWV